MNDGATKELPITDNAIEALAPSDVAQLLRSGRILLIDVREPKEYEEQRIAGALLFPLSSFDNAALPRADFPKIVFQCGSGKRSLVAARKRLEFGASRVAHMAGGLAAWKAAGLPVLSVNP
jgi:rhodanese-related sulfurtransferase